LGQYGARRRADKLYPHPVPELPEVETIRRDLEPLVTGRRITGIEVDPATLPLLAGTTIEVLRENLVGRTVEALGRRGKYLLFGLDDGRTFVVHLRMTGRLTWRKGGDPPEKYERARILLDDGHELRWSDLRKFGTWRVIEQSSDLDRKLGREPIDASFTLREFRDVLAGRRAPVKAVLLDQRRVAGLGNIYVDEALFQARVRPDTPAGELSAPAVRRLYFACRDVLERGIENRGASFRDYVDGRGEPGRQHMHVQVFRRTGQPCYVCGTPIRRSVVGGRSSHFCPRCQKPARARPRHSSPAREAPGSRSPARA
jgi:formamidopyrimidine-DNA glycosylase